MRPSPPWPVPLDPDLQQKIQEHWQLRDDMAYLNHGSYGACPRSVLRRQQDLRAELEQQPVHFFQRRLVHLLNQSRRSLGEWIGADPEGLVFVDNATTAVCTVLEHLQLSRGDEILSTDHSYGACRIALERKAKQSGARLRIATIPLPLQDTNSVLTALQNELSEHTRFVLIDHVFSSLPVVLDIQAIVRALKREDLLVMVDGAHAPGMVKLDIEAIAADFYTGNGHKWLCAPKGAAFLWSSASQRPTLMPLVTSYGEKLPAANGSVYHRRFDWTGTRDPSAWLCLPKAITAMNSLYPGGWPEVQKRNAAMIRAASWHLNQCWGQAPLAAPELWASMATLLLPPLSLAPQREAGYLQKDPRYDYLLQHGIEVPCFTLPDGRSALRISAQLYNRPEHYEHLGRLILEYSD